MDNNTKNYTEWLTKYLKLTNYLSASQLLLKSNFFLEDELKPEHFKDNIKVSWNTISTVNFIWGILNYVISQYELETLLVVGPTHSTPSILSNLFVEGTLGEIYNRYNFNAKEKETRLLAYKNLMHDFNWPGGNPLYFNASIPGTITGGSELGDSLSLAWGAALDNPDIVIPCIIGDKEAETGNISAAWKSNKLIHPKNNGNVLPIIYINNQEQEISSVYNKYTNDQLIKQFEGLGYEPILVEGNQLFEPMLAAVEASYKKIQEKIMGSKQNSDEFNPPMIILKIPHNWFGPNLGKESNFSQISKNNNKELISEVSEWLKGFEFQNLVVKNDYRLSNDIEEFIPKENMRLGVNERLYGQKSKDLTLPSLEDLKIEVNKKKYKSPDKLSEYIMEVIDKNQNNRNFKVFAFDNLTNLGFEKLDSYVSSFANNKSKIVEILNPRTLLGWFLGYIQTGRNGIYITEESYAQDLISMVDKYTEFLNSIRNLNWRDKYPSLNFVLIDKESVGDTDRNTGFVSAVLNNYANFIDVYFPVDVNTTLTAFEECISSKNKINLIVTSNRSQPQWLDLKSSRKQLREDILIWDFVSDDNVDVVMVGCGDVAMNEVIAARLILKKIIPEINIRIVNIAQISCFGIGDNNFKSRINQMRFDEVFTNDKPIIFNYHGYEEDIKSLIFNHHSAARFLIHGYNEKGLMTTPFDILIQNGMDRFTLALEAAEYASVYNSNVKKKQSKLIDYIDSMLKSYRSMILEEGKDPIH
ncbi:hypothetical protein GF362_00665 [Candidatus Dojkabacteria bacterium]|nr:hypothetical protein [Candidatus Dojkabacteria bacterium]